MYIQILQPNFQYLEGWKYFLRGNHTLCFDTELKEQTELLILPGGSDVDPKYYGQPNKASYVDRPSDTYEHKALIETLSKNIPVFGICKGFQWLHVVHGGILEQHVDNHHQPHAVLLFQETGEESSTYEELNVNSSHHQAVVPKFYKNPTKEEMTISVLAEVPQEGIIEAARWPDNTAGVQWHPEWSSCPDEAIEWSRNLVTTITDGRF